jgi:RHS repeat-associated protein
MIRYILVIAFLLQQSFSCYSQCGANDQYGCAITGPSIVCVGKKVSYQQGCNYNFNKFNWSDGNGNTSTTGTFTLTFTSPGEYCIKLVSACARVGGGRDEELEECEIHGEQVSYKHIIVYSSPAPPVIAASPSSTLCGPQAIMFTVTNPQAGLDYAWTSAGQTIGTGTSISRFFESSASIMVTAAVPNESACSASATQSIQVISTDVDLAVESQSYHSVLLRAVGTGSLASYYWQTSVDGESTSYPATTLYEVSNSGRYFLRRRAASCWAPAKSIDITVSTIPTIPEIGIVQYPGYSLMLLANSRKDFIYQFADYFIVNSETGTETDKKLEPEGNSIYTRGSYIVRGRDRETGTWSAAASINVELRGDENINWIYTKGFDGTSETAPFSETKSYFGEDGKSLQTQAKLHTEAGNFIFTSGELRDKYDRSVGSTLPVPIASSDFMYNASLRLNEKADNFSIDNDVRGTAGWYYSNNNTLEDHVPVSDYPYTEVEFYNDGTGEVKRSAGVGEVFRMGAAKKVLSGTFPVFHELDDYLLKRKIAIPGIEQHVESLMNEGVQSVVRDENGKYAISISDRSGSGVMTARAGTDQVDGHVLAVTNSISSSANPVSPNYRKMTYFYILNDQRVSITGSNDFIVEDIVSDQRKAPGQTFAGSDGKWPAGFYRVLLTNVASQVTISYTNYFQDISYQFYDDAGRLVSSVSPNGMKEWLKNKDTQTEAEAKSKYIEIDKTTFRFNFKGWLLSMKEPDAGETNYQYRKDGKIRFSQNAQQLNDKHFSYTQYDHVGRPVESGEYSGTQYTYTSLNAQLEFENQVQFATTDTRDWVTTHYDYPDDGFNVATRLGSIYSQDFVKSAVSWTENANMKTWYSYDELGRVTWMAQKPTALERIFVVKYTYNFIGSVLTAANLSYDLNGVLLEQFYHYYEYDANSRLSKVYTSATADEPKKLRATYTYYLHGPLKRIELGDKLQGIDFIYNIHGWLTQINHPDKSKDPGKDGNDVFGMILNYYEQDLGEVFQTGYRAPHTISDPAIFHKLPGNVQNDKTFIADFEPQAAYRENMLQNLAQLKALREQKENDEKNELATLVATKDGMYEEDFYAPSPESFAPISIPDFKTLDSLAVASVKPVLYAQPVAVNVVPDDIEFAALKDIFTNLAGTGWLKKTNWPTTWPTTATSDEFAKWYGVGVVNGDVVSINLPSNRLTGAIPASISNLTELTSLYLQGNSISGSIPTEMGSLSKLTLLYLYTNKLTGTIPASFGNLKNLVYLYLLRNTLTGTIPSELSGMTALQFLRLEENNLSGALPASIGSLTNLVDINLYDNAFTGAIPAEWNALTNLKTLNLATNKLSGDIPVLDKLTKLVTLDLRTNTFTGEIPLWLTTFADLENLYLGANKLSGTIPASLGALRKLKVLTLNTNTLNGSLPPSLGELSELVSLYVNQNQLSGELPPSYGLFSKLQAFHAGENKFTGNIPESYSNLKELQYFNVANNLLSGEVPDIFNDWTKATSFYISSNKFTGAVPASVGSMMNLTYCYLSNNAFTSVPSSLLNLKKAVYIILEGNKLHDIPDFTTLPNKAVMYLYVRNNYLDAADLEPLYSGINTPGFKTLMATPQFVDPGMRISVPKGEALTITAGGKTANTTFVWEKQSGTTWTDVTSANQSSSPDVFEIASPAATDAGIYRYKVTTSKITALAIISNAITVQTVDALPVVSPSDNVLYNGLITSVQWRTDEAYSSSTGDYYGQYQYAYDDKYQLAEANYADFNKTTSMFEPAGNNYRLTGMTYDANGNIFTLKRYDGDGLYKNNLAYFYLANTNKLDRVNTYVNKFTYNAIGQMTGEDKENDTDQYVEYDVTGKVRKIYMDSYHSVPNVEYLYDDRGFRLAKISYQEKRTTWYIRDASGNILSIYEQSGVLPDPAQPIQWTTLTNVVNTNGTLTVQSGSTTGVARSSNKLEVNQDGYLEYTIVDTFQPKDIGFALSGSLTASCYFNFSASPNKTISIRKSGANQTGFAYVVGDKIKLEKKGDKLYFWQNTTLRFEISGVAASTAQILVNLNVATASVSNLVFKAYATEQQSPSLTQIEVPIYGSGKLGTYYPAQDGSAAYEISDHLGNVRALVRENINIYTATMEDNGTADLANPRVTEMNYFQNIFETEVKDVQMNHTQPMPGREDAPDKAAYLYWVSGTQGMDVQDKSVGPAIALKVNAGDKVNLETWARYEHKEDYTEDVSLMMFSQLLGTSFAYVQGFDAMSVSQTTETFKGALPALFGAGIDVSQPRAYLNYIVFNTKMEYVSSDRVQVSEAAGFEPDERAVQGMHEKLAMNVSITEAGYIYVWVSNGSENTKVWFDDFSVSHTSNFVTQATDFGTWGDVLREQKTDESIYRYSYQGQFAEKDLETGWNHFELREYDPIIGRWLSPDPARQYPSPYVAYGNNPVSRVDPDGGTDGEGGGDFGPSPESLKLSIYFAHIRGEAANRPGILESMANAGGDFVSDLWQSTKGLVTGETYSKIWKGLEWKYKYWAIDQVNTSVYVNDLSKGGIPGDQIAYDFTYGALSYGSMAIAPEFSLSKAVGTIGAGISYSGFRIFGLSYYRINSRITTLGMRGYGFGQFDAAHRASTFFRKEILKSGFPGVRNWNTIYFNKTIGGQPFSIGINPWKRTIFHEGPGVFK